jgi:hypothetical protein
MNVVSFPYFGLSSGLVTFVADKQDKWHPEPGTEYVFVDMERFCDA